MLLARRDIDQKRATRNPDHARKEWLIVGRPRSPDVSVAMFVGIGQHKQT